MRRQSCRCPGAVGRSAVPCPRHESLPARLVVRAIGRRWRSHTVGTSDRSARPGADRDGAPPDALRASRSPIEPGAEAAEGTAARDEGLSTVLMRVLLVVDRTSVGEPARAVTSRRLQPAVIWISCWVGTPALSCAASSPMSNGAPNRFCANAADRIQACCSSSVSKLSTLSSI